jgi:DNA-binding transcriptional MerR regulator
VCELADVQAYVLRSWEAEFPDLGVAKTPAGPRVYRRADVERVLRIKQLVFSDGLTLAGARRRLIEEMPVAAAPSDAGSVSDSDFAELLNETTRQELLNVRRGLSWILGVLSGNGVAPEDFVLRAPDGRQRGNTAPEPRRSPARASSAGAARSAKGKSAKSKPARKAIGGKKR